jgi:hypothetical protein
MILEVPDPGVIDFSLPPDAPETRILLEKNKSSAAFEGVGCAKWNRTELKGFILAGTKDELIFTMRLNSIELNATVVLHNMPNNR